MSCRTGRRYRDIESKSVGYGASLYCTPEVYLLKNVTRENHIRAVLQGRGWFAWFGPNSRYEKVDGGYSAFSGIMKYGRISVRTIGGWIKASARFVLEVARRLK